MNELPILEQAQQEIARLEPIVTRRLQEALPVGQTIRSRWNGAVALLSEEEALRAKARFRLEDGAILVAADLMGQGVRWRTFIHELLHAHSLVRTPLEYDAAVGWEEGVVEYLQRSWRDSIFHEVGLEVDPEALSDADADWDDAYGSALKDLEFLRHEVRRAGNPSAFYVELLTVPVGERYTFLLQQVMPPNTGEKRQGLFALSKVRDRLNKPHQGT
jgi:hypothetical protein